LAAHGLGDLSPYDVHDALVLMEDTETAEFSHDFTAGAHLTPPSPDGSSGAHQYLSAYLAPESSETDGDWGAEHLDPDADLEPLFASGGVDGEGYVIGDDTLGFGEGAATLTGSGDPPADPEPAYGLDADDQPAADVDFDAAVLDDAAEFPATPDHAQLPDPDVDPADHAGGEHHAPIV